jgi:S-methylmethionine-dependent homocysteine/selenocysteine methylase
MQEQVIRCVRFFQCLLYTKFRRRTDKAIETLIWLTTGHLFGLYNPNQLASALEIPKASVYRHLKEFSSYQWKRLLFVIGCSVAIEEIKAIEQMSRSTKSRRCITISIDDTVESKYGKTLSCCYSWWSRKYDKSIYARNILAITIKVGAKVVPLNLFQ